MTISRTGGCPVFLEYVTRNALIPRAHKPTPEFQQLTQYNFQWIDIPSYQRGLVWDEETFEDLLESRSAFLGNAIMGAFPLPTPRGAYATVPATASDYLVLIDGLQRFSIGTAVLSVLHTLVLTDFPQRSAEAPLFAALRVQSSPWAPVYEHNHRELLGHQRNAVSESYAEFRETLASWITNEFDQGRANDLADKVTRLFLGRQIAPDVYHGFKDQYDVTSTFIGLNTVRVQLNVVDWLRSVIVDRGGASWNRETLEKIDNRFTDVFTRGTRPEAEFVPFASIILDSLLGKHATKVFPSWDTGLSENEVEEFLGFVDALKSAGGNAYYREIRECGKMPLAGCLVYYYRLFLAGHGVPSFVQGGKAEDAELHKYLRGNLRSLLSGGIGRTRPFSERLLRESVSLSKVADDISFVATGKSLDEPVDPAWLTATLKITDKGRAPRVFNACLLPDSGTSGGVFNPHTYGRKPVDYQVDHLIPESVIKQSANQKGAAEGNTLCNFAPIRRTTNVTQTYLMCSVKLSSEGSYATEKVNDPNVHPYVHWLVTTQAKHGAFLDQLERLEANATPAIAEERVAWLANRLGPRL